MGILPKRITDKQEKFVQGLIKGLSQREAYKKAYPGSKKWKDTAIDTQACILFNSSKVLERYNELHSKVISKAEEKTVMSAVEVMEELSMIGRSRITDYLEVKEVDVVVGYKEDKDGKQQPIIEKCKIVDIFNTADMDKNKIGAIAEIKETKVGMGLKLHDKVKALEDLMKRYGLDKPEESKGNLELINDNIKQLTEIIKESKPDRKIEEFE